MTKPNSQLYINNRSQQLRRADDQRINEVSRIATELQKANPDLSRSEALRVAEKTVPHRFY